MSLGNLPKAKENYKLHLSIAKEVGDKAGEGCAYTSLGNVHYLLGDPARALEYHHQALRIAKEVGDKVGEGISYYNEGNAHATLRDFCRAESSLKSSCENRSFEEPTDESLPDQMPNKKEPASAEYEDDPLKMLYDLLIRPIADYILGGDVTIVPDGPLFLTPFAALMDQHSSYLSEKVTLRLIPTLTTLKIMAELSERYQSTSGVLLVGDPWVGSVRIKVKPVKQLENAEQEVERIGEILKTLPLTWANKQRKLRCWPD
ncbi:hypothetical protein ACROYT_G004696 [Oculina patagonica]